MLIRCPTVKPDRIRAFVLPADVGLVAFFWTHEPAVLFSILVCLLACCHMYALGEGVCGGCTDHVLCESVCRPISPEVCAFVSLCCGRCQVPQVTLALAAAPPSAPRVVAAEEEEDVVAVAGEEAADVVVVVVVEEDAEEEEEVVVVAGPSHGRSEELGVRSPRISDRIPCSVCLCFIFPPCLLTPPHPSHAFLSAPFPLHVILDFSKKRVVKAGERVGASDERALKRKQGSTYDLLTSVKQVWEVIRPRDSDLTAEQRSAKTSELISKIHGHMKELIFKHDSSRVIQTCLKYGKPSERSAIVKELLPLVTDLCKSQYGKFLARKLFVNIRDKQTNKQRQR